MAGAGSGITQSGTGGGSSGVSSVNALTGAVVLAAGTNISLVPSGNTITINSDGALPASILYADLLTLYNAGMMTPGFYNITDGADAGIVIQAISSSRLALNGTGLFLNPDFISAGDYSGVIGLTGIAYTTTVGIWDGIEGWLAGVVVFYNGLHYQVIDAGAYDGSDPSVNTLAYQVLPKTVANVGYILTANYIEYDFPNNLIVKRRDVLLNNINPQTSSLFQWGNPSCFNNDDGGSNVINNINQRGLYFNNKLTACVVNTDFTSIGNINDNIFNGLGSVSFNVNFVSGTLSGCIIESNENTTFADSVYSSNTLTKLMSDFPASFVITGLTTFNFTATLSYIGFANLTSTNPAETINLFANFPLDQPVQFRPESGLIVTFSHATGANQPICAGGISAVINGSNGDWIEFTRKETYAGSGVYRIYQTKGETY